MMRTSVFVMTLCLIFYLTFGGQVAEATRKLPFNGSIFGKRSSNQGTQKLNKLQYIFYVAEMFSYSFLPTRKGSKDIT